jgi:hypothetical protein
MKRLNTPLNGLVISTFLAIPLATYFIDDTFPSGASIFEVVLTVSLYQTVAALFLGYISFAVGKMTMNPIKAYGIGLGLAFLFCWMGANNVQVGSPEDYDYYEDPSPLWTFFRQFVWYSIGILGGLFLGMKKSTTLQHLESNQPDQ